MRPVRPLKRISNIEVSAFAAILVVLLGLFAMPGGISVGLPDYNGRITVDRIKAKNQISRPYELREDAMIISVTRDGSLFFRGSRTTLGAVPQKIQEFVAHGAERRIYLNIDQRANYRDVKEVVEAIHSSGVEQVSILGQTPVPTK